MEKELRVLIVEDIPTDVELVERELKKSNIVFRTKRVETREALNAELEEFAPDIVLSDYSLPSFDGMSALRIVRERDSEIPFIFVSGSLGEERAIDMLKNGATDYILKDKLTRLVPAIQRALRESEERLELERLWKTLNDNLEYLSKKNRYETIINSVTRAVHQSINLQDVLDNAVQTMSDNIDPAAHVAIYFAGAEAELRAWKGYDDRFVNEVRRLPRGVGIAWRTMLENRPVYVPDADVDEHLVQAMREAGTKSYVSMPIQSEGKTVGSINIYSQETDVFDEDDLKLLENVAQQIGVAINNAQKVEALSESERRFALFMKNLPGVAFMKDAEGCYIYVNEALQAIIGKDIDCIGKTDDEIWPPDVATQFKENDRIVMETGEPLQTVQIMPTPAGASYWLTSKFPIFDKNEATVMVGGAAVDVTERKRAESRIIEQAALLDIASDAITVRDLEHRILFWSKGAERIYGWQSGEAVGKRVTELLFDSGSPEFIEAHRILNELGEYKGEMQQATKGGKSIIVECRLTLVTGDDGSPKSILAVTSDITEKKRFEAQFLRAQRMESIGTLAGGIAHDLNNVLQPILMALQILRMRFPDEKSQRLIDTLESSTERGSNLVRQVLSFARGQEGERTILQVKHIAHEIERMVKEAFPKSIDFRTNFPRDLWNVMGDFTQLHQVLMNLCVNARDAMPEGGTLEISGENLIIDESYARMNVDARTGPYIVVSVADNGEGIPPSIIDKIFEPFFTTKDPGKGTGLGLSTSFGIVKDHGGFIHVYSEPGKGTTFRLYLPAVETSETKSLVERLSEDVPLGRGETVLVVDDEASIREITRSTLETYGYKALTACDGAEAVSIYSIHRDEVKVIIMDMTMPIMDGQMSIRALRRIDPNVRVIFVSGFKEASKLAEAYTRETDVFLSKPFTAEVLLKTLRDVITRKTESPEG